MRAVLHQQNVTAKVAEARADAAHDNLQRLRQEHMVLTKQIETANSTIQQHTQEAERLEGEAAVLHQEIMRLRATAQGTPEMVARAAATRDEAQNKHSQLIQQLVQLQQVRSSAMGGGVCGVVVGGSLGRARVAKTP